ncbi:MAG: polysaccharide deacetylase family protein [Chloroflexota bacterium]|nr:polysaccharide deacetylase family protein [Chloroflexota bacterium]
MSYRRKAEYYRRRAARRSARRLFALGLLLVGVVLPFASAMLAPTQVGGAAALSAALPTAHLRMPTPQPKVVALAQAGTSDQSAAVEPQSLTVDATPAPAVPTVELTPVGEAAPALPIDPTLTSTPILLAPVEGGAVAPVATLFPTVPVAAPADQQIPGAPPAILMYHYIRSVDQGSDPLGYELSVTPDDFNNQMTWLHEQGYIGVRMDGITRCLRGEAPCPAKAIALTFDDGYVDAYTDALPVLRRYGLVATFYIVTNFVGQPGYMTWEQVAALRDAGMEIGAHTVSHLDLTSLDWETANVEIAQSKAELDHHLNMNVTSFCYPTGLYNAGVEEQVRASGYLNATTTRWDNDISDIMALPRRRISGGTALDSFAWIVQS